MNKENMFIELTTNILREQFIYIVKELKPLNIYENENNLIFELKKDTDLKSLNYIDCEILKKYVPCDYNLRNDLKEVLR